MKKRFFVSILLQQKSIYHIFYFLLLNSLQSSYPICPYRDLYIPYYINRYLGCKNMQKHVFFLIAMSVLLSIAVSYSETGDCLSYGPDNQCSSCSPGYALYQGNCMASFIYSELTKLNNKIDACCAKTPKVSRIAPYDLCGEISLHQQNAFLTKAIPIPPGKNVYGLLISFFYTNVASGVYNHGYMSAKIKQTGDSTNYVKFVSRKFNWYANTANEMEIVPWSSQLINTIDIEITDTYNTEGSGNSYGKNKYECRLVGYLTYE
jgi:hypothetical protein